MRRHLPPTNLIPMNPIEDAVVPITRESASSDVAPVGTYGNPTLGAMVPVVRNDINQDAPWTWRLDDVLGLLSDRQRRYVESLPRIFRLRTAAGKVVPYKMEPYQAYWHSYSPLALGKKAPSRIVEKG